MNSITHNATHFDNFVSNSIIKSKNLTLESIQKSLEDYDLELAAQRNTSLKIIKIVRRTILTSIGPLTFKRRYYYDEINECYLYLLDSVLQIPKYSRLSSELKIKILKSLDHLSYRNAGIDNLPEQYPISKVTVFNLIRKTNIIVNYKSFTNKKRIHLQIDEKYISIRHKNKTSSKQRLYTATIFTDIDKSNPNRNKLVNRLLISARYLDDLFKQINYALKELYIVKHDDFIYISGDLASYIQNSKNRIDVCKAIYVPDKFHIQKMMHDVLDTKIDESIKEHFNETIEAFLDKLYYLQEINGNDINVKTLIKLFKTKPKSILNWFNDDYLGCSQEAMNSHFYASRLDKVPNTFSPKSLDILCTLLNAKHNNLDFLFSIEEQCYDLSITHRNLKLISFDTYERSYLSLSTHKKQTRDMFKSIISISPDYKL